MARGSSWMWAIIYPALGIARYRPGHSPPIATPLARFCADVSLIEIAANGRGKQFWHLHRMLG
jgi:hypothetical protein